MSMQKELKQGLHEMIDQIKDVSILQAIYVILERETGHKEKDNDFYDALNASMQASIERGLQQINSGKTVPHEEVRKRYEKWLK